MDTLFKYIEDNNWDALNAALDAGKSSSLDILSLAEHARKLDNAYILGNLLGSVMEENSSLLDKKTTLAVKSMRFEQYECFDVVWQHLDNERRYECLRDSVVCNREQFLKIITSQMDSEHCWKVLEYATKIPNPNILDHLLDVCPVPFDTKDIEKLEEYAPYICDTVMDVASLGWNNCLERILNLTPQDYDAAEVCVLACEKENWDGARIALKFTSEDNVRTFDVSFDPQLTKKNVGIFLCQLEDERLNVTLTHETTRDSVSQARRKM